MLINLRRFRNLSIKEYEMLVFTAWTEDQRSLFLLRPVVPMDAQALLKF